MDEDREKRASEFTSEEFESMPVGKVLKDRRARPAYIFLLLVFLATVVLVSPIGSSLAGVAHGFFNPNPLNDPVKIEATVSNNPFGVIGECNVEVIELLVITSSPTVIKVLMLLVKPQIRSKLRMRILGTLGV